MTTTGTDLASGSSSSTVWYYYANDYYFTGTGTSTEEPLYLGETPVPLPPKRIVFPPMPPPEPPPLSLPRRIKLR